MRNDIIVLGGPGSGKDTQAELIADEYEIPKLDAGETLRQNDDAVLHYSPDDTVLHGRLYTDAEGEPVRHNEPDDLPEYQKTIGQWLPDPPHASTTAYLTGERMQEPQYSEGVVFSGYPRTLKQAELMEKLPVDPAAFIVLDTSRDEAVERLMERERADDTVDEIYDRQRWQYHELARIGLHYMEQARDGKRDLPPITWIKPEIADQDPETVWDEVSGIVDDALYEDDT